MSYVPHNDFVFCQAFAGACDGLLAKSVPLTSTAGYYAKSILVAAAFAEAFDTAWGVSTDPDSFEYESIFGLSNDYFLDYAPVGDPGDTQTATYTGTAADLLTIIGDGEAFLAGQGIVPPPIPFTQGSTVATVLGGATYDVKKSDRLVIFDESNGEKAVAVLPTGPTLNEIHTFVFFKFTNTSPPPEIDGNGSSVVPYGQGVQASGAVGPSTAISNPGGIYSVQWDGVEWMLVSVA